MYTNTHIYVTTHNMCVACRHIYMCVNLCIIYNFSHSVHIILHPIVIYYITDFFSTLLSIVSKHNFYHLYGIAF